MNRKINPFVHDNVMAKKRDSNMELMRVFSMFLVLLVHCCFFANGNPYQTLFVSPFLNFYYCSVQSFALVCVNCFILISGFYGIKLKINGILNLIFIFIFYKILFLLASNSIDSSTLSIKGLLSYFNTGADWFVWCYILLMIFSPLINDYIKPENLKTLKLIVIIFFTLELLSCFLPFETIPFDNGYSFLSFVGLYILARCYRVFYSQRISKQTKIRLGIALYFGSSILNTILYFINTYVNSLLPLKIAPIFCFYSNPLVIIASLAVLIFFSGLRFQNSFINWLAKSSFAIYLIHLNPFVVPYFVRYAKLIYQDTFPALWLVITILYCVIIYVSCTIIDQLRLILWNIVNKRLSK